MKIRSCFSLIVTLQLFLAANCVKADQWLPPTTESFLSGNREYSFVVVPAGDSLDPRYIQDDHDYDHPKNTKAPANNALGILYHLAPDSIFEPCWISELPNGTRPVAALVHDEGKWVVTFDDWAHPGRSNNTVVIYDHEGVEIRGLALEDMLTTTKILNLPKSVGSTWWRLSAEFVKGKDLLEIRTISNDPIDIYSYFTIFEDYVRLRLSDGELESFRSDFDDVLATYSEPCGDEYLCSTMRYYYYRIQNPDEEVLRTLDSLQLHGSAFDSLRAVYDAFHYKFPWKLGRALQYLGRRVLFACGGFLLDGLTLVVEGHDEIYEDESSDSISAVILLPDSTIAFLLAPHSATLSDGLQEGATNLVTDWFMISSPSDVRAEIPARPRFRIHTLDTTIACNADVRVLNLARGSRVFIDLMR